MNKVDKIAEFQGRYRFLSNFYPAYVTLDGSTYFSSEAAYQAYKSLDIAERMRFSELSAGEAKKQGSQIPLRADWEKVKFSVMERIVRAKFTQNPYLAKHLVETGDSEIVEGNTWNDVIWGVDLTTGEGQNNLGKILMKIRNELQENGVPEGEETNEIRCKSFDNGISVRLQDISRTKFECVVNEADETLFAGWSVFDAIHREAGEELIKECQTLGGCRITEAKITNGYNLAARYVIHTVSPHYGGTGDSFLLELTLRNILDLAKEKGIHSIAIPAIGCAKECFPNEEGTRIAAKAVVNWKNENPDYAIEVAFTCADPYVYKCFCEALT
ncbi:MAG: NADAR domain-containing protein [Oscillospiraceae bacterium]|nr:NADAR domain-containing protein [Oscillospiraceae bacterium]